MQVNHFFSGSVIIELRKFVANIQGILHHLQIGIIF